MKKGETITSYFMRITNLRNKLLMVGHTYDNKELVMVSLNGLPLSWENFRQGISARCELPKFDRLQVDYIQEECNWKTRGIDMESTNEDIEALTTNLKRKKGKNDKQPFKKQKDLSCIQCYRCDKYGHTAARCPDKLQHQASFTEVNNSNPNSELDLF